MFILDTAKTTKSFINTWGTIHGSATLIPCTNTWSPAPPASNTTFSNFIVSDLKALWELVCTQMRATSTTQHFWLVNPRTDAVSLSIADCSTNCKGSQTVIKKCFPSTCITLVCSFFHPLSNYCHIKLCSPFSLSIFLLHSPKVLCTSHRLS